MGLLCCEELGLSEKIYGALLQKINGALSQKMYGALSQKRNRSRLAVEGEQGKDAVAERYGALL